MLTSRIVPTGHVIPSIFVFAALAIQCRGTQRYLLKLKPRLAGTHSNNDFPLCKIPPVALPTTAVRVDETTADAAARLISKLDMPTPSWALKPVAVTSTLHGRQHHVHICYSVDTDFARNTGATFECATPTGYIWSVKPPASELSLEDTILLSQIIAADE